MVKTTVEYLYHGLLLNNKKEWTIDIHNNFDGIQRILGWEKKASLKSDILLDSICITFSKWQKYGGGGEISCCQKLWMVRIGGYHDKDFVVIE